MIKDVACMEKSEDRAHITMKTALRMYFTLIHRKEQAQKKYESFEKCYEVIIK